MTLLPLIGHESLRSAFATARAGGRLPGTILLHGPRGVGKQRLALWIGQTILCDQPDPDTGPCGSCRSCRAALQLAHADLHWHFPLPRPKGSMSPERMATKLEEARWERLEELRARPLQVVHDPDGPTGIYLAAARTIRAAAARRPSSGESQVFIVGEAQLLVPQGSSPEAANALLKLLEEPGAGTTIILTTSEPGRMLDTIRSRTIPVFVPSLEPESVAEFLVQYADADPVAAADAARFSGGSIGRALGFLPMGDERGELDLLRREAYRFLRGALEGSPGTPYRLALEYGTGGGRALAALFDAIEEWVRDLAAVSAGATELIVNLDARSELERLVRSTPPEASSVAAAIRSIHEARTSADGNANPQLVLFELSISLREHLSRAPAPSGLPTIPTAADTAGIR